MCKVLREGRFCRCEAVAGAAHAKHRNMFRLLCVAWVVVGDNTVHAQDPAANKPGDHNEVKQERIPRLYKPYIGNYMQLRSGFGMSRTSGIRKAGTWVESQETVLVSPDSYQY